LPRSMSKGAISRPSKHIVVGTEPYGLALTPNGKKLYVSNSRSDSVSVIDTTTDTVIKTIFGVGPEPRGLAITNDGDADDNDEAVYVTQFLSLPVAGKVDGQDDAKTCRKRASPPARGQPDRAIISSGNVSSGLCPRRQIDLFRSDQILAGPTAVIRNVPHVRVAGILPRR
jgi:YVTN family beta-propeller protein